MSTHSPQCGCSICLETRVFVPFYEAIRLGGGLTDAVLAARYKRYNVDRVDWKNFNSVTDELKYLGYIFPEGVMGYRERAGCLESICNHLRLTHHLVRQQQVAVRQKEYYSDGQVDIINEAAAQEVGLHKNDNDQHELDDLPPDHEFLDETPVRCPLCNITFADWADYCIHVLGELHQGEIFNTNIRCPICEWIPVDMDIWLHMVQGDHMKAMLATWVRKGLLKKQVTEIQMELQPESP
jgi:hypothetical protein